MYTLENLRGTEYPSKEYERTLRLAPPWDQIEFPIEKELATRRMPNGREKVKVRWLFYGPAFDQWIDREKVIEPRR